jgi:hypothetical protein
MEAAFSCRAMGYAKLALQQAIFGVFFIAGP